MKQVLHILFLLAALHLVYKAGFFALSTVGLVVAQRLEVRGPNNLE